MEILEEVSNALAHYSALPILINYIKKKAHEGDAEARETLDKWDKIRNG